MRIVIQRVKKAQVQVDGKTVGKIRSGMVVFLGVRKTDTEGEANYLVNKILQLRIFQDEAGKMNWGALEVSAEFLVVSQFTLYGSCVKGRRPSFDKAASPKKARDLYLYFVDQLKQHKVKVQTGQFQAMMDVDLVNDGPVTFILEAGERK